MLTTNGFELRTWKRVLCCGTAVAALSVLSAGAALAQAADQKSGASTTVNEVVVTGTLLRGVAPAGAEVVGVNQEQIQGIGAVTTDQLLAQIPQVSNEFNGLPSMAGAPTNQVQINRLDLRDLPGGTASGNSTLVLLNGNRITAAGVTQFAPDADVIPPSLIERVEIVPDGGSSIYGTDAVGGVINFITKNHVDGLHVDVQGGVADHYNQVNTDLLFGRDWGTGSAYIAWDYEHNSDLPGSARSYVKRIDWLTGIPTGTQCPAPNISIGNKTYAYPGLVPGTLNTCDTARESDLAPRAERNSFFGGVTQDFGSRLKVDVKAYYTEKNTSSAGGPLTDSVTVGPTNPFYVPVPGSPTAKQNVSFAFGGNDASANVTHLKVWGVVPSATFDLGHDWQLRGIVNVGGSDTSYSLASVNGNLANQYAAGTTTATAINPYNIAATPNQQLVANMADYQLGGESRVEMTNLRLVADGPLFNLPAGPVRLAMGGEYLSNHLSSRNAGGGDTPAHIAALPYLDDTQSVSSGFAELKIPLVGGGFTLPFVKELGFSASGRYDSYNDFGSTFNPKLGATYKPVDWLTIRGSWGTSFNAPTPIDELNSKQDQLLVFSFPIIKNPFNPPASNNESFIALTGASPNLQPQKAIEKSIGFDVRWPFVEGLKSSLTYYSIDYNQLLATPPVFEPGIFFANFPNSYVMNPTSAQVAAFVAQVKGGAAQLATLPANQKVYELVYYVLGNIGNAKTNGVDFSTSYVRPMDFGRIDITVTGNYEFLNQISNGPGLAPSNNLLVGTNFRLSTVLGADIGHLRAQLTWNHTAGYKDTYDAATFPQTSVGAFDVVNLFFRYKPTWQGWGKNTSFTLNVDNVADANPPVYKLYGANGSANGATLGRLVELGVHKDF